MDASLKTKYWPLTKHKELQEPAGDLGYRTFLGLQTFNRCPHRLCNWFCGNHSLSDDKPVDSWKFEPAVYSSVVDEECIATMAVQHCDISTAMVQREVHIQN
jgi:hypothetical protein